MIPVGLCEYKITTAHPIPTFLFQNVSRTIEAEILCLKMYNTKGDVALTNINRETNCSMILCSIQSKSSFPFLSLGYVLSMFLNLGYFSVLRLVKWFLLEKIVYLNSATRKVRMKKANSKTCSTAPFIVSFFSSSLLSFFRLQNTFSQKLKKELCFENVLELSYKIVTGFKQHLNKIFFPETNRQSLLCPVRGNWSEPNHRA